MATAPTTIRRTGGKKSVNKRVTPRFSTPPVAVATVEDLADPALFEPLTEGERADSLRLVTESSRLRAMAKVGRYRVIAVEPLVLKPPHERAGGRLARVVIFDYSANKCVDASVDLDNADVFHTAITSNQPMLSADEEAEAVRIALANEVVNEQLALGDEPLSVLHYWSKHPADMAYARRSAAVLFGQRGESPSLVSVVNLIDGVVAEVMPGAQW